MAQILFGRGAGGDIIRQIQHKLLDLGCDPKRTDGVYDSGTEQAIAAFQVRLGLPETGLIDDVTWLILMQAPIPAVESYSLRWTLTSGTHNYTLAQGNFD